MTSPNERPHDDPLETLLAAARRDAPAPDAEFLGRLRDRSTEAFVAASSPQIIPLPRRRRMVTVLSRALTACAATLVIGVGLWYWFRAVDSRPAFDRVLRTVDRAESVRLRLTRQGKTGEVWIKQPFRLRWDEAEGVYQVAVKDKLWQVDEQANRATPHNLSYFKPHLRPPSGAFGVGPNTLGFGLDLFALLGLPSAFDQGELRQARPVERVERDGLPCLVYRFELPAEGETVRVEALADAATQRLHSVEAHVDRNGQSELIAALTVLAYNEQIPEDKFLVKDTLSEDGRVGKVTDAQGTAAVKPAAHERWTPVTAGLLLRPGDWLRTDARGANAVACRLLKQTGVILGPGALVEVVSPTQLRLNEGEVELNVPEGTIDLMGPEGQKLSVKGKAHYRLDRQKLVAVAQEPLWLKGFKGTTANESLGSLVANVDGRNVPLTVGYHKVTVDIRDQIARTTVEESFVNHTDATLEGVFYFPLPQDASISGFGMWIGNELVMADVVEKQRAREIYETILRERRDPGLLEWAGGNLFKARVFPIFGHSEKRIKIIYTQVLPLRGNRYRYSYALQSEMLRQHPLRELAIDVRLSSALPLKSVTCPTHPTRSDKTANSARVEFAAQQYTPTRDFEMVVEIDGRQSDVVMIPHRRGDDGYFMLQLTPPAPAGDWDRPVLTGSQPLQLLILADTSASMDAGQRAQQADVIAALLGSLTPKDTVNLAGCDVECDWVFEKPAAADAKNAAAIRQFLAQRTSLGWTDLDRAFASVLAQCGPETHVVYVGDGTVTTRDADPVAFGQRLRRLYDSHTSPQRQQGRPTFHAVAVGSTFEPAALKAVGAVGGSFRRVTTERGPQATALELLYEITQPVLRDLKVEFKGIRAARVYPEELPNLAPGSQHIVLGRYLPEGRDQEGEVVVTGTLSGKPLTYRQRVSLRDAEQGNSFIPRLWARQHLDHLLEQGTSAAIRDEIIALSEEYQIITPYTSFLVLETDADRERFAVKRSFRMRDGEKFFQEGLDKGWFELTQQQMKRAGTWRLALRRQALQQLATLGRSSQRLEQYYQQLRGHADARRLYEWESTPRRFRSTEDLYLGDLSEEFGGRMDSFAGRLGGAHDEASFQLHLGASEDLLDRKEYLGRELAEENKAHDLGLDRYEELPAMLAGKPQSLAAATEPARAEPYYAWGEVDAAGLQFAGEYGRGFYFRRARSHQDHAGTLLRVFPQLHPPARKVERPAASSWPEEARILARSLLRTEQLAKLAGGVDVVQQHESFDTRWGDLTARSRVVSLYSPKAWLQRSEGDGAQTLVNWCDPKERGIYSRLFLLGRARASAAAELREVPLIEYDHSLSSLEQSYSFYVPTVEHPEKDRAHLILKTKPDDHQEIRFLIDTRRHVLLHSEYRHAGKITSTMKFDDFVEIAGSWWARTIEAADDQGRRTALITLTINKLPAEAFAQRIKDELADRERVLFLRQPLPRLAEAKKAISGGKATFEDHFTLLLHFAQSQQWTRVRDQLALCEKLAADKAGLRWLHDAVLYVSRWHEELRKRVLEEAGRLAQAPPRANHGDDQFLASHLFTQAGNILETNEYLAVLETLRPVYERQPRHTQAMKTWRQYHVNALRSVGREDDSRNAYRQLATDYPRDYSIQQGYAQTLFSDGAHDAAYAWLKRVLVKESRWLSPEEESLRSTYAGFLQQQGRYPELVEYLAAWIKENPESQSPYAQYLGALVRAGQLDKANALIAQWLKEGLANDLAPPAAARLSAAVAHALGSGHGVRTDRPDERWFAPLAAVVRGHARHKTHAAVADQIMGHGHFQQTDTCRQLRKAFTQVLLTEVHTLTPEQVQRFLNWVWPNDPMIEVDVWRSLAEGLRKRWEEEKDEDVKHALGQPLRQIYAGRLPAADLVAFLRRQVADAPARYRIEALNTLFNTLLAQPWSAEDEDEVFTLLGRLSDAESEGERLAAAVQALHRLTDRIVQARYDALMKQLEHPEKLTRTELRAKQDENRKKAREGFADRLTRELATVTEGRQPPGEPGKPAFAVKAWVPWLTVERIYLDVLLERNLAEAARDCWHHLGDAPKPFPAEEEPTTEQLLDELLRTRCLLTLGHLATRRDAKPEQTDRLLLYIDKGIAAEGEGGRWKQVKYQLLVALDRPKELEKALRDWLRDGDPDNRWRLSLGYVLAEQGRIPEAIRLFEGVEFGDTLGPTAYRALADWYLVANRRDDHERATAQAYRTQDENLLSRWLRAKLSPWQRGGRELPSELDREVLTVFAVLFEKSTHPAHYVYQLQQFYEASRDFRLLAVLADSVIGHSAAKVYPFLIALRPVLQTIHEEATADSLFEHLTKLRAKARTDVDHRALDLLEVHVRRRAAEIKNQPGPHAEAALAALRRAFQRQWGDGEPRLMADFLADLGAVPHKPLAEEQLRQLEALHAMPARGSFDRLHIAHRFASALWGHGRREPAADLLQAALKEFQDAHDDTLPVSANSVRSTYITYLENLRHYARGEKTLLAHLQRPIHQQQTHWLTQRLYQLYNHCLAEDGTVSLGAGRELYQALNKRIQDELGTRDHNHRYALVQQLCGIYRTAHQRKIAGHVADLRTFAFKRIPGVLEAQTNQYAGIVSSVAQTLHDVASPRDGLAFLIERIENEPAWFRLANQDGWSQHAGSLAYWRTQLSDLGDLEPRLLKLVLTELRRDLESQRGRYRTMYLSNSYFWTEKADDFARAAEEVWAQRGKSNASVQYIADYMYHGLGRYSQAIEMLFAAHKEKLLDEGGQAKLVTFLHERDRHAESIGLLRPLVQLRPDNVHYRVQLLHAYFRTKRQGDLEMLLMLTDGHFRKLGKWTEPVIAALAHSCLTNRLYQQSVDYYQEVIPLHQRTHANRGVGNGTLSDYYAKLAAAYAALRKTPEAVDAASGAIVSWGPTHQNRAQALRALVRVLEESPDLDGYVAHLDAETAKSGKDSPVIRKAVGQVYLGKNAYAKALTQLRLALELQPNDRETHHALLACFDKQNDKEGAVRQLLQAVQLARRELGLYRDLGRRLAELNQAKEAERAYTSIVEVLPHESESHTALAEVRQDQKRWAEAMDHWRRVAALRALEPTGLLKLAAAQVHEKEWTQAAETLKKVRAKSWPPRFDEELRQVRDLERQIEEGTKN